MKKQQIIKSAAVDYCAYMVKNGTPWGVSASIQNKGYEIKIENVYFATIDDAAEGLKEKLSEVILKFGDQ